MARGRKTSIRIRLTLTERQTLLAWQREGSITAGQRRRGRILILVSEQRSISDIARMVGISRRVIYKWVQRFLAQGLEGLVDRPSRRGWRLSPLPAPPDVYPFSNGAQGS